MAPRDFFVCFAMFEVCANFRACAWFVDQGLVRLIFIGGAVESFCHAHFNIVMGMCSGEDLYQLCEVSGRSDFVWLSYKDFLFHGEALRFVMPPRTGHSPKTLDLHNITSLELSDNTTQIWCWYNKVCGRSSSHCKTCHFLWPAGGAITVTGYRHVNLFRSGLLLNVWILRQIEYCMPEL